MTASSIHDLMMDIGHNARQAARVMSRATSDQKEQAIRFAADSIISNTGKILEANHQDLSNGQTNRLSPALIDRLRLDAARLDAISKGLITIAELPDPVGQVTADWKRPNGLNIKRVRTPLGVVGVIYESRPGVTADAGALCVKSGNAVILRGGSDAFQTSCQIHDCMAEGLQRAGLPETAIQLVPVVDRTAVGEMLAGLEGNIDVIVPRGGKSLVGRVQQESRVPIFAHLEGICHVYVHRNADLEMAKSIVVNSKLRRPGICGAAETLLLDRACVDTHLQPILSSLSDHGCEVRGDDTICKHFPNAVAAQQSDWSTEYLAPIISAKVVENLDDAIHHIETYSSGHTEAIVTDDIEAAKQFVTNLDSAILLHNASTQFADGGEFGMGAEIGIATGKMHARGPVGVEQLTSFHYQVFGSGQTRPT